MRLFGRVYSSSICSSANAIVYTWSSNLTGLDLSSQVRQGLVAAQPAPRDNMRCLLPSLQQAARASAGNRALLAAAGPPAAQGPCPRPPTCHHALTD